MPALVGGIHVFFARAVKDVDGRDTPTTVRHAFCFMPPAPSKHEPDLLDGVAPLA
jgi:hypothetical protein